MLRRSTIWLALIPILTLFACATAQNVEKRYPARGVVQELYPDGKTAKIKHEAIPSYMPAMTMDLETKSTNELRGLAKGDVISFQLVVTEKDGWIENVKKLNAPPQLPTRETMRIVRDVQPLKPGDIMPEYRFTNEFGKVVKLGDYKGKAYAITFIFTRCPFPNFCPRMSNNFADVDKLLRADTNAPTNWHLFSLSFDPENDTPEVLNNYAKHYHYDPEHWSFLTGELIDITAITEQFGQQFWRDIDAGGINHNLRTAIVDATGRVRTIYPGNTWTPQELAKELTEAAKAK